ncbi:Early nodulin-like protein 2 [Raphanus sativus]|uniref:Early nodulin-like protein 2 isoform X1 n=1 Tax=Raphanus sativus TaxID=3726 RepID=A0A6J0MJ85_RAPSA|nr:early nodulin-like protein 2 isoform X1 [Raphanus sativus]KAJ4871551.1 Early nodulin-like protein 2 [Raphanus sativus]
MAFTKTKSLCFFTFLLSFSTISVARRFGVGGSGAWVPNPPEDYGSWAGKGRFLVHDTLYFTYAKGADSVLEVSKADYDGCNTKNPIKRADDGNSEISLDRSGPFYFISGNEDNCKKGQKLTVVVLSVRTSTPPPPQAATPENSPPGSMPPKSSSPVSPATSPPAPMPPKSSSSPVSPSSAPVTSPPGSMSPKSSSPVSPMTSPPSPPSSAPGSSPSGSMAPKSSSAVSPSLAPGESPSSISSSPSGMGPSGDAPSGSAMGPSGDGPSSSGGINAPAEAPGEKKSSANGMAVMSVTTVLSLVLTIILMST